MIIFSYVDPSNKFYGHQIFHSDRLSRSLVIRSRILSDKYS